MNYTRGGKETLDGIVRVWRRQLRVVASRYSPLQASLFCFGTVVINGSAFRFIVHFRRDWFSRHRFCCGLTLCANTPATIARVFVANYWCLFLEPSIYIYIYIYFAGLLGKNCVDRSNAFYLPSSPSIASVPNFYDIACNRPWCNLYPSCCNGLLDFLRVFFDVSFFFFPLFFFFFLLLP